MAYQYGSANALKQKGISIAGILYAKRPADLTIVVYSMLVGMHAFRFLFDIMPFCKVRSLTVILELSFVRYLGV